MVKGMKSFLNGMKFYRILSKRFRFYKPILMVWLRMDWREHKIIIYLENSLRGLEEGSIGRDFSGLGQNK